MLDNAKLMGTLIGIFVIVGVAVAISTAGTAVAKADTGKATRKGVIFLISVAILGLTGLGVALVSFGREMLIWAGFNLPTA